MTDDIPAFPTIEVARVISAPGMTLADYAMVHFIASEINRNGMQAQDAERVIAGARRYVDALLSHR